MSDLTKEMYEALKEVNKIVSEGAAEGFNYTIGDWADRLFQSQQKTHAAIRKYEKLNNENNIQ